MINIIAGLISLRIVWYYFYLGILPHNSMKLISIHFYAWMKFFRDRAIIFKYYLYQKNFVLLRYILVWMKIILEIAPIYYGIKKIWWRRKIKMELIRAYWFYCRCYAATAMAITTKNEKSTSLETKDSCHQFWS